MADTEKSAAEQDLQTLRHRPQRRKKRSVFSLFGVLGTIIIVTTLAFVGWQILGNGQHNPSSPHPGGKTGANTSATIVGDNDPAVYWSTLKQQIAEGLRLSVSDVQSKVQSASSADGSGLKSGGSSSPPIVAIAAQQNISGSQWHTVEINALQRADQALVGIHTLTQRQADQRVQDARSWTQDNLDGYINYAFTSH